MSSAELFIFSQHRKSCRSATVAEEKIEAIPHWEFATRFTPTEQAVLAYTDALEFDGGRVADGVFASLKECLSDEEILELTYIGSMYEVHAVISRALRTEFNDVDDRMKEVDCPDGPRMALRIR